MFRTFIRVFLISYSLSHSCRLESTLSVKVIKGLALLFRKWNRICLRPGITPGLPSRSINTPLNNGMHFTSPKDIYGVRDGTWTRDILSHSQVFYHLNYSQHNSGTWDSNPEPRQSKWRILPFEIVPDCLNYFFRWGWRHSMLVTYHLKFVLTKKTIQILSFPMVNIRSLLDSNQHLPDWKSGILIH